MKGIQKNFDVSGTSRLSLADAGLGAAAGFLVPVIANRLIASYGSSVEFLSDEQNRQMVSAAAGIVVAIPLYFWRGMAPAMVAAVTAILYGVGGYVTDWVTQIGAGTTTNTTTTPAFGRGRSVGLLQQASRQVGAVRQAVPTQAMSRPYRSMEFAGTAD